jgi:hypothetical protein
MRRFGARFNLQWWLDFPARRVSDNARAFRGVPPPNFPPKTPPDHL